MDSCHVPLNSQTMTTFQNVFHYNLLATKVRDYHYDITMILIIDTVNIYIDFVLIKFKEKCTLNMNNGISQTDILFINQNNGS